MIPVVVWYVAVNAAAFGLCAAARSRRTGGALSALVRLTVVAGGAPGMLLSRAIWRRGPRETGPLALAWPLMWLLLHAAVLAALADRAGGFRIRETALLSLALAGGALGALAAMHLCRHKIRTPRFAWGVPVLLAVQCALLAWGSAMG